MPSDTIREEDFIVGRLVPLLCCIFTLGVVACSSAGCQPQPVDIQVTVLADGTEHAITMPGGTVRDAIAAAGLVLGGLDRVTPDLWEELRPGTEIQIVRVEEFEETQRNALPFERKVLRSEAMSDGESRLVQLGAEGLEEVVYRVTKEDGVETDRVEIRRRVLEPVVHEVLVIGVKGTIPSVPISGTIAYISGGNAWMMRSESGGRRPLTAAGDLDGRIFELSSDGRWLMYSRMVTDTATAVLNHLWVVDTTVVGQEAWPLGIDGALYAGWSPDGDQIAYSLAERSRGSPGWKAHNDLWVADIALPSSHLTETLPAPVITPTQILEPNMAAVYAWWGTTYAWSPTGEQIAFGNANSIGIIELATGEQRQILKFPEYHTYAEWVWTPTISWSPDGRYVTCTAHAAAPADVAAEDSPLFHVYVVRIDGLVKAPLAETTGMWANPSWAPNSGGGWWEIAFGLSRSVTRSQDSEYDLLLMDRDGSDKVRLFPPADEPGLVATQMAWSPYRPQLVVVWQGDLYKLDVFSGQVERLTGDGNSGRPRWAK